MMLNNMKSVLSILLIIGFSGLTVFGLTLASHGSGHSSICLASAMSGAKAPCPQRDLIGFVNFHFNALKNLSLVVTILLSIIGLGFVFGRDRELPPVSFSSQRQFKDSLTLFGGRKFIHWLKLHENSPSFA